MCNSLLKKFIDFGMGSIIVLLLGFVSSPIITRLISPEEFGKMSMFNTVTSVISILAIIGMDQSFVRFFYDENEENRGRLLIKSIKIPLLISLILIIFIYLNRFYVSKFIIGDYSNTLIYLLLIQILGLVISRFSLLSIRMAQKGKLYSTLQVIGKLSYIVLVISIFTINGNNYSTIVYSLTLSNIIVVLISIFLQRDLWIGGIKNKVKLNTNTNELIRYGYPLLFTMIITWLFESTDKISINMISGYTELGIYSSAFTIVALLNNLQSMFSTFWTPVAFERYRNNSEDKEFFRSMHRTIAVIFLMTSVMVILFKDTIILLLGEKYKEASFIMPFLVFSPIMYTVSETTVLGINFLKKPNLHIYIAIVSCLTNIIGNIILVPIIGAKGAAISTGISYIVFFSMRTWLSTGLYKVNYGLKNFYISTISVSILAIYMSFNKINTIGILLGVAVLIVICINYIDIIKDILSKIRIRKREINEVSSHNA